MSAIAPVAIVSRRNAQVETTVKMYRPINRVGSSVAGFSSA
jgi:hypothetical protein